MVLCPLQVDSFPVSGTPVTDIPRYSFGLNQQTYERLKVSLSLNLRRQIFIAVCDDLPLRDRLAMQLQSELALSEAASASAMHSATRAIPSLVTLDLSLDDPNPVAQIVEWLSYFPRIKAGQQRTPAFQFLGVERLTRQSAELQSVFLAYLQTIEQELPALESGLLLWMTRPWFRMLPEAAPKFWDCRTGVFEFVGDPTPLSTSSPERIRLYSSSTGSFSESATGSSFEGNQSPQLHSPSPAPDSTTESQLPALSPPTNPWLPLAADLNTWYEPDLAERHTEPITASNCPQQGGFDAPLDERWSAYQILEQELKRDQPASQLQYAGDSPFNSAVSVALQPFAVAQSLDAIAEDAVTQDAITEDAVSEGEPLNLNAVADGTSEQSLPLLQHIQLLQEQITLLEQGQESTTGLAIAYRTLGNFYRDCIEQGEASAENLTNAIQAYEQALHWLPEGAAEQAETLNDLGNLYWLISQYQSNPAEAILCLQQTEQIYQQALAHLTLPQQSQTYAMVQNNLGAIYADLARYQEPVANLQQSIAAYQQSLQHRSEDDPIRYASTQNNLGTTYWNLAQHQQPQLNLKQAIAAYAAALDYYDPNSEPLTHAMIQNNLGTAYWNLAQYEQTQDYLMLALTAYQAALQYRTLETVPASFAATQNNLGTAYWHLANTTQAPERITYLQQSITAYQTTLAAAEYLQTKQPESAELNFDRFATHNNLGLAHHQLGVDLQAALGSEEQAHQLTLALQHHLAALQGWEANPDLRQTALNCVVQTMRAFYTHFGLPGQNQALAQIPGHLLPEILPKL